MPKHDFLAPKAISNRVKARGLQKLKWYCQMCQKQCRDQNGFKCHCISESHRRQMLLFAENPNQFMDEYSKTFERAYLLVARVRGKRLKANDIYKDVIADRHHIHMNATVWSTLANFVQHLARSGQCEMDRQGDDWFVRFLGQAPEDLARREGGRRGALLAAADFATDRALVERQIDAARRPAVPPALPPGLHTATTSNDDTKNSADKNEDKTDGKTDGKNDGKNDIKPPVSMAFKKPKRAASPRPKVDFAAESKGKPAAPKKETAPPPKKGTTELEKLTAELKRAEELRSGWAARGMAVRVANRAFGGGRLWGLRAVVLEGEAACGAGRCVVRVEGSGEAVEISEREVEAVVPEIGKPGIVTRGRYYGETGVLKRKIDGGRILRVHLPKRKFSVSLKSGELCEFVGAQ